MLIVSRKYQWHNFQTDHIKVNPNEKQYIQKDNIKELQLIK